MPSRLISVALRSVPVPVEIEFLVVFGLGVAASFGLGWLVTRWRPIAKVV